MKKEKVLKLLIVVSAAVLKCSNKCKRKSTQTKPTHESSINKTNVCKIYIYSVTSKIESVPLKSGGEKCKKKYESFVVITTYLRCS